MTLSIALWRPTSSRTISSSPSGVNRPVACSPPVRAKPGWRSRSGRSASSARAIVGPSGRSRRVDRDLLQRALAAHAARGRRVEGAGARVARQRPRRPRRCWPRSRRSGPPRCAAGDQALAVEEAERELLVVAGRAHRDRERRAVDADLQRLLDGDLVADAVVLDGAASAQHSASAGIIVGSSPIGRTSTATTLYSGHEVLTSARGADQQVRPRLREVERGEDVAGLDAVGDLRRDLGPALLERTETMSPSEIHSRSASSGWISR